MIKWTLFACSCIAMLLLAGCPQTQPNTTEQSLRVTPAALSLTVGESQRLSATSPDPLDSFQWSSNAPSIATVSTSGVVTAVAEGNAVVTVTGTNSQLTRTVPVAVPGVVAVSPTTVVLRPTRTALITARSTNPADVLEWSSTDTNIATVNPDGIVTAVSEGEALVTATGIRSNSKSNTTVLVLAGSSAGIEVTPSELVLEVSQTTPVVVTSNDPTDTFVWTSSNKSVATVDQDGVVTALAEGDTTIAATGLTSIGTGIVLVTVIPAATAEINISPEEIVLRPTGTANLTATSSDPADTFIWFSSNRDVATVEENGTVTAIAEGHATVVARGIGSGAESTASVTVSGTAPATVAVSPGSVVLRPTRTVHLAAASTDERDTFAWSSSNDAIATVDGKGLVTAVAEGEATITAVGSNSDSAGTARLTVAGTPPAEVSVTPVEFNLQPSHMARLDASSTDPADTFTWFSSDPRFATVSDKGLVTGVADGHATIVARGMNSGVIATAAVTIVTRPAADVAVSPSEIVLRPGRSANLTATSTNIEDVILWSSSNDGIATVDDFGVVSALAVGIVTVTATGSNSNNSGEALVTVAATSLAEVDVSPSDVELRATQSTTLEASSTDPADTFIWSSSDDGIVTVDANGTVSAVAVGQATILARGSNSRAVAGSSVTVSGGPPATININPEEIVLRTTRSSTLQATSTLQASSTLAEDTITWASSDNAVATVDAEGTVYAVAVGQATVTATGSISGATATARVTVLGTTSALITIVPTEVVLRPERTSTLVATSTNEEDAFNWSSSDLNVATIDAEGKVTGVAEGEATMVATGTVSRSSAAAFITVSTAPSVLVDISPAALDLNVAGSAVLTALSSDPLDSFTWISADESIATVNGDGLVTPVRAGETIVTARGTNSRVSGSAIVRVFGVAPAGIGLVPTSATIRIGESTTFSATSTDPEDTFLWSSTNNSIAMVSAAGTVTGATEGSVTIEARGSNSNSAATATVTVSGALPAGISISPKETTLRPTQTVALTATSTDSQDTFTWTTSNTAIASVTLQGTVVAIESGTVIITARGSHSGDTGTASVTVAGKAPAAIEVDPATSTLRPAETVILTATSTDVLDTFTWTSSDEAVATVSPKGTVTGVSEGQATIAAAGSASGDSGTATITVSGRVSALITVNPDEAALRVGQSTVFSATSTDTGDNFAWTSSNESVATVIPNGTVVAMGVGTADITATGTASGDTGSGRVTIGNAEVVVNSSRKALAMGTTEGFSAASTDPNDTTFTWSSSNENVAEVSARGVVLGRTPGTATIRALGKTSGSAGLQEVTVVPAMTSLLLWDGEAGHTGANGTLSSAEAFRGSAAFEATPTKFVSPTIEFVDYPGYRSDISGFDEIWFFAKADLRGRSTNFRLRGISGQSNTVDISNYIEGGELPLDYRLVRIPIADLQTATNLLTNVQDIFFGTALPEEGHKFYIDDIWAVSLAETQAEAAPLVGALQGVSFGTLPLGNSLSRDVTVTNIGSAPLHVSGLTLAGTHALEFSVTNTPFSLNPGQAETFSVAFTPDSVLNKAVGDKRANLRIAHNLTPMGTSIDVPLTARTEAPAIALSTDSIQFGSMPVGQIATKSFFIENPGNVPLTVASIAADSVAYVTDPAVAVIAPGATQEIDVTFTPLIPDDASASLTIASDALGSEVTKIALNASAVPLGTTGVLAVEPGSVTSSTFSMTWPAISGAASVQIYLGPEPAATKNGPLPAQMLMDTVGAGTTTHTLDNLAPGVDMFVHLKVYDIANQLILQGNSHAKTPGGPGADLDGDVREVHLVAPHILQVVVANLQVHSFTLRGDVNDGGLDEVIGDVGPELQAGPWTIFRKDGSPIGINAIHRQSLPVGAPYYTTGADSTGLHLNLLDVDHFLYFVLDEPVGNHEFLTVTGPELTRELVSRFHEISEIDMAPSFLLPFSDKYLETGAIQLNQMGYSPVATERYAYVSAYMGDGGPVNFNGFPAAATVYNDPADPLDVRAPVGAPIPMALRPRPDGVVDPTHIDNDAGTYVREIDLSAVPHAEGVVYRVHIPGVGVSWPTQVSETAVFRTFYITTRFMTHNRWGRVLSPDWTEWSPRPGGHPTVFTSELHPEDFRFFPVDTPQTGIRLLSGGHYDAADFDINFVHVLHAMNLLRLVELRPDVFADGQLNIPESGNGIPDLIDEILYNVAAWEQLQEVDGGVRAGLESYGHPTSTNFADLDELPYWVYARGAYHTLRCAGIFAQLATLLEPILPEKAAEFRVRAIAAYNWAMENGATAALQGPPMYASGELYRLTGETTYRDTYEQIWDAADIHGIGPGVYRYNPWASSWFLPAQPILLDHPFGYLLSPDPEPFRVEQMLARLTGYAEEAVQEVASNHAHRNGRRPTLSPNWGRGTTPGEYVHRIYARLQMGGVSESDLQRYYNAMSLSADYALGCNPLGMSWISGLGTRRPMEPQHADSRTFVSQGFDPIPGIVIYGPRSGLPNSSTYDFGRHLFYPEVGDLPFLRRFADVGAWPGTAEFTITETQVPSIRLFGMLVAPGMMPPETWLPGGSQHRNNLAPREDATQNP